MDLIMVCSLFISLGYKIQDILYFLSCFVEIYKQGRSTGFIRVREMSGKFNFFQGQGIVREFYVVSGKSECFLKCQGNVREF